MTNDPKAAEQLEVEQAETLVSSEEKPAINEVAETNQATGLSDETRVEMKRKSTTSERKAESNRRNADKATGPKTARGKKIVSMNALKRGYFSRGLLVPHADAKEDRAEYDALYAEVTNHYRPAGWHEQFLAGQIVSLSWRLQRSIRGESGIIAKALADYRYQSAQSIEDDLKEEGCMPEKPPEISSSTDHLLLLSKEDLDGLLRHQAMIYRQLNHVIAEIERVQASTKGKKSGPIFN
jgi:hypothetical protein